MTRRWVGVFVTVLIVVSVAMAMPASAAPGDLEWSVSTGDSIKSGIGITDDGTALVGSNDRDLRALDVDSGTEQWSTYLGIDFTSDVAISDGGTAVVGASETVYGIDTASGTEEWSASIGSQPISGIAISNGIAVVAGGGSTVYGFDVDTGSQEWSVSPTNGDYTSEVIITDDGTAIVHDSLNDVIGLDVQTGSQEWSFVPGYSPRSGFALTETGTLVVGFTDGNLYGVDAATGSQQWSTTITSGQLRSGVGLSGDETAVIGDSNGEVYGVEASSGSQQWSFSADAEVRSDVAVGNDVAVFGSDGGTIYGVDTTDGSEVFSYTTGSQVRSGVGISDTGTAILGDDSGDIYAFQTAILGTATTTNAQSPPADLSVEHLGGAATIEFRDASDDSVIETVSSPATGAVSTQWNYDPERVPIRWYAVALDSSGSEIGQTATQTARTVANASPNGELVTEAPATLSAEVGAVNEVYGGSATVEFQGPDGSVVGSETLSSDGTATATVDPSEIGGPTPEFDVVVSGGGETTSISGVTFDVPTGLSVTNISPRGGEEIFTTPITVSGTPTFSDSAVITNVTLSLTNEGRDEGTTTVSVDSVGNISITEPIAGENQYTLTATDAFGNSVNVTETYTTPEELKIRDEQNPDTLITNPGSAEVRFYTDSDQVNTRSPDNGTIPLAGLPADETFVASVSVEGYNTRTITIDSLLEQQTAYLLSENATVAEVDFELNDQTNQFPADQTTLFVQRAITRNNSTAWRTIVGERFGATGTVPTTLAAGDRYRLKVRNRDGDLRALGSYVAAGAAVEPLRIGQVTFQGAQDSGASFSSRFDSTSESEAVDLRYVDPSGDTDELNVTVRRQDANNTVVFEDSISGPLNTYRERIPTSALPDHTDDSSYQVEYSAARSGAAVPISGNRTIGDVPSVATDWPIDPQFLNIAGYLFILALFGAMVILSPRHAGLVGSATAFALSIIGVIAINSLVLSFALVVSGLFAVGGES